MKQLGPFRLEKAIARGGYSTIFLGKDDRTGAPVAVKIVSRSASADPVSVQRFRQETAVLTRLSHPNLVPILDAGETELFLYYVMPYIDGGRLGTLLRKLGRPLPLDRCLAIFRDLAGVLVYVHGQGIIHRDVKPDNVMFDSGGRTVLMDFGLIRLAGGPNVTRAGAVVGTLGYVSPEQIRQEEATPATDVYQLGLVMYECLTGRRAVVEDPDVAGTMQRILRRRPEPPSALNPEVPAWLDALVVEASEPDLARRIPTAEKVLTRLSGA